MGEQVLKNCKLYFDGYDISGHTNNITLNYGAELQDRTSFGSTARKRIAGLTNVELTGSGYFEAGTSKPDTAIYPTIGSSSATVLTVCPTSNGAAGERAFSHKAMIGEYAPGGNIGEIMGFSFAAFGEGSPLVRGVVAENSTALSTGLSATPHNLGTGTSTQKVYAALHAISVSSSAAVLDFTIQCAGSSGFSIFTTQLALNQITDTGGHTAQWKSTAASTDKNWYRLSITSTSTAVSAGSLNGIISIGIK